MVRLRIAGLSLSLCLVGLVPTAGVSDEPGASSAELGREVAVTASDRVTMDTAYHFDAEGLLSLTEGSTLPIPRASIVARWYALDGWAVVVFEGLDLEVSGPLCLGTAAIDASTGLLGAAAYAPTSNGACDDAGAGALPMAGADGGVRTCADVVAFVTRIPQENRGAVIVNAVTFAGDGTGIGVSGRLDAPGPFERLDRAIVDCGPLPRPRQVVPATPIPEPTPMTTPAPASAGRVAAADRAPAPAIRPVDACPDVAMGTLEDVHSGPAGPYLVRHPIDADATTPTVVFLPGGGGGFSSARRVWQTVFSEGAGFERYRIVIPYSVDSVLMSEARRTLDIVDEVLWCHAGDPMAVHLAGASNGGLAAFGLMVDSPERFATLLGAPGAFPVQDPASVDIAVWQELLAGRAVFNGVGVFDTEWRAEVIATHNALASAGIASVFAEFPGQGHVPGPRFDSERLLRFWESRR